MIFKFTTEKLLKSLVDSKLIMDYAFSKSTLYLIMKKSYYKVDLKTCKNSKILKCRIIEIISEIKGIAENGKLKRKRKKK